MINERFKCQECGAWYQTTWEQSCAGNPHLALSIVRTVVRSCIAGRVLTAIQIGGCCGGHSQILDDYKRAARLEPLRLFRWHGR